MKKYKKDINFNIFVNYKMLFSKMLSCVVVFFILISLIKVRGIGVDVDFLNESMMVSKKMVVGQVRYMTAFSVKGIYYELTVYMDLWNNEIVSYSLSSKRSPTMLMPSCRDSPRMPSKGVT